MMRSCSPINFYLSRLILSYIHTDIKQKLNWKSLYFTGRVLLIYLDLKNNVEKNGSV